MPVQLGRLDALLERAYRRLGWRLLLVHTAATWSIGLVPAILMLVLVLRIGRWSSDRTLQAALVIGALSIVFSTLGLWATRSLLRPLSECLDARGEGGSDEPPWSTLHRLPIQISLCNAAIGLLGVVAVAAYFATGLSVDASFFALLLLITLSGIAMVTTLGAFGFQLVFRPLIRDVAGRLATPPPPHGGISQRAKLLVAMPVLTLFVAVIAVLATLEPGTPWGDCLWRELAVSFVCLLVVGPAGLMLARSTLEPLEDLMQATERLKHGDFTTRVPELSGDEYGALAESFNEAIAGLAERERLARVNERLLDEVRSSRARIIAASDAERRRVERNLHDGAQQRLVALALDLQMLRDMATTGDTEHLRTTAENASQTLDDALDELRELARGLHPSVLATDGLAPALEQAAARAPVPVDVTAPEERYPEEVESTAYFVASEALANIAKYAAATHAAVSIERRNGCLLVQISDDGVGGAGPHSGSGLAGLRDRVAALDGTLTIDSPVGRGTAVRAELPLRGDDAA
jgi:signal transduction histidine kinase